METYLVKKERALEKEPVFKRVNISKVHIIDNNTIDLNGKIFNAEFDFITQLADEIGISPASIYQLGRNLNATEVNLILNKSFNNYFKRNPPILGNVIGDREKANLFRFSKSEIITYKTIFEALDNIYKNYSDTEFNISRGDISLLLKEDKAIDIKGLPEETFIPNIGMRYIYGEAFGLTKVMNRLSCTNQIRMNVFNRNNKKLSTINSSMTILKSLKQLNDNRFNLKYADKVAKVKKANASLHEYESVIRMVKKYMGRNKSALDTLFRKNEVELALSTNNKLNEETDKRRISTPLNYWEMVNGVTDFASHNYVMLKYDERELLQTKAFELLERTPDLLRFSNN
ncbi:MAG: hypothetical protein GXO47_14040 [Chlorobi bacterium]|nr:hypothetical protein [Chlorobiota bacterium]